MNKMSTIGKKLVKAARIWWLGSGFGKMSKRLKPFENKGKKNPVYPENQSGKTGFLEIIEEILEHSAIRTTK
jgi:hypothetical protein